MASKQDCLKIPIKLATAPSSLSIRRYNEMRRRRDIPINTTKSAKAKRRNPVFPISYGSKRKIIPVNADNAKNVKKRMPKRYEESDIFSIVNINQIKHFLFYFNVL